MLESKARPNISWCDADVYGSTSLDLGLSVGDLVPSVRCLGLASIDLAGAGGVSGMG